MEVDIFIPCFIDQMYPQTGMNMVRVLEKCGCKVHYNEKQTCCGQPAFTSGRWDDAKEVGEKFIRDFSGGRKIVTPSASCAGMVKNYYPDLFHNTVLHNACKQIRSNIYEFTDFLVNALKVTGTGACLEGTATYHDSCSALREYGVKREPRLLLENVKGLKLQEMEDTDTCCGFGGAFSMKFEAISSAMAEQKVTHALAAGADYIVSTDSSCLLHLEGYIKRNRLPVKTMHIADVLAAGWGRV